VEVVKDSGLYDNIKYSDDTREATNTRGLDVKPPETERPLEGVSQENGVVNGSLKSLAENGYSNGGKENGHTNGDKKKGGLFKRLSLQR
jgi:hypothetical protein